MFYRFVERANIANRANAQFLYLFTVMQIKILLPAEPETHVVVAMTNSLNLEAAKGKLSNYT
jgi:hypothetical protein